MEFSIKYFFSKCDQIRRNFFFWAVQEGMNEQWLNELFYLKLASYKNKNKSRHYDVSD